MNAMSGDLRFDSTDRRNGRHLIKRNLSKLKSAIKDIDDDNVKIVHTRRGVRFEAQKFIYNKHSPSLYNDFLKLNPDVKMSVSTYYNCKPFYVSPANQREMEACMCSKCLNPHSLYEAIRQNMCGLPHSLTEYLTDTFKCSEDTNINYARLECIKRIWHNMCKIRNNHMTGTELFVTMHLKRYKSSISIGKVIPKYSTVPPGSTNKHYYLKFTTNSKNVQWITSNTVIMCRVIQFTGNNFLNIQIAM